MLVYIPKHHRISLVLAVIENILNIANAIDLPTRKITLSCLSMNESYLYEKKKEPIY
jgi:hypothetical protein